MKGDYKKLDIVYDDDATAKDDKDEDKSPAKTKAKPKGKAASKKKKADEEEEEDEEEDEEKDGDDDKEEEKNGKKDEKEPAKLVKAVVKGGAAVDPLCRMKDKVHVYSGAPGNKIYAATLNQSDVKHNNNKFYIVQLLQSDTNKGDDIVFRDSLKFIYFRPILGIQSMGKSRSRWSTSN